MTETAIPARPWLDELAAKYGAPGLTVGPVRLREDGCFYTRESWIWLRGGRNHSLVLDQFASLWVIRAITPGRHASVRIFDARPPTPDEIRAVLVVAGMLETANGT